MDKNKGHRELKGLSINLTKCDGEISKLNLRSRTTAAEQAEMATVSAGKRNRRLMSAPPKNESEATEKTSLKSRKATTQKRQTPKVVPAKRTRHLLSTPATSGISNHLHSPSSQEPSGNQGNSLSKAVALNCQLTNELLSVKKQLFDKSESLLKMQQNFYEKEIECKDLLLSNVAKDAQIAELKSNLEKLHAEHFCTDLINFEDAPETTNGKSANDGDDVTDSGRKRNEPDNNDSADDGDDVIDSGRKENDADNNDDMPQPTNNANAEALVNADRDSHFAWTPTD